MSTIVFVHGIGQQNVDAAELCAKWLDALKEGLTAAGQRDVASRIGIGDVTMAYYGHLFRKPGAMGDDDEVPAEAEAFAAHLAAEWVRRAATRASDPALKDQGERALHDLTPGEEAVAQGTRSVLRAAIAAASELRSFAQPTFAVAERLVNRSLRQVSLYMANVDGTRDEAQKIIAGCVSGKTRMIIAHSLGSVAAYEACHRAGPQVPLLLTIGSPLGLDTIVYDRTEPQPPSYPDRVAWWVNVADRDDIVAAAPDLTARFFPPLTARMSNFDVNNRMRAHDAVNYLQQPEVVFPVSLTLQAPAT